MVNIVMLVGRLVNDPDVIERANGKKISRITLAVSRKFKSADGTYHTDFIDCILWDNFAKNVNEYCSKGDLIAVRGRLHVDIYEKEGIKKKFTDVIAESITFLSSTKNKGHIAEAEA